MESIGCGGPVATMAPDVVNPTPDAAAAVRLPWRGLLLLRAFAVLLPLGALVAIGFSTMATVEQAARGRVERVAEMLHEHALRAFDAQELTIAAIAHRMQGMGWPDVQGDAALYGFLRALDAVNLNSGGLALVAPGGLLVMSSTQPFGAPARDVASRDYVAAQRAGSPIPETVFIGQVVRAAVTGAPIFPIVRARPRADGLSDGGTIVAALLPGNFQSFYRSILESPQDQVTLFRLDGAILAAVPEPADPVGAALPRSAGTMLRALRSGPLEVLQGPSPFDGTPRMTAIRRLARHDVGIAYGLSQQALYRDWRRRMIAPLAGAVLSMAVLLAAIWQAERSMRSRSLAESRARTAERQATLGLLAGGLAHDFGNITQSVSAAARLLQRHAEDAARVRQVADLLESHATRATALSRRLLDTTRRSDPVALRSAGAVDITASLRELAELLDATLGAGIRVRCDVPPGLRSAPGLDRAELETALINLAANARDAMPQGGEVWITAHPLQVPPRPTGAPTLTPGNYHRITVRDSGQGMSPEALARLGEPFFTTKPPGRGTGLGLAMVAAFLRRADGALLADSRPGRGTAVHMLLPAG
ncbi:hybrid sensor histidine kinase/response regulator [Falsiroseomonas sp.]|uniref:hybrid sensor histidine kinase/response regulator n=1 Tax=Falsiroseomonas sp. TaxID=2870721 RepID=UPI002732B2F1|nr:hybrid sensor histidine kinase/response regulator [Falsiroseomonas sp.]